MRIIAIDPGSEQSAWMIYSSENGAITAMGIEKNNVVLMRLCVMGAMKDSLLAIEGIASYGMSVGKEVFDTCIWIGRFIQEFKGAHRLIYRPDIKLHLCQSRRAKDPNVRQALIDRFGGKDAAIGKRKNPGPLYGVHSHVWSALAVAVVAADNIEANLEVIKV